MKKLKINDQIITLEQCVKSDKNFILKIVKDLLFPYIEKFFEPKMYLLEKRFDKDHKERYILRSKNKEIGFIQYSTDDNHDFWIKGLFVIPKYQNLGLGSMLMTYFEELAKESNTKTIRLKVIENNPAYEFYKKRGFVVDHKKEHRYFMKKEI